MLNTKDISKDFGRNLSLILSHIKITYVVSEISIFEAYMLKRFCNGNLIDVNTFIDDSRINAEKYPVTHRSIRSLFLLNKNITDDTDVTVKPGALLFPSKCIEKGCVVTFQGQEILSILGSITKGADSFFMRVISTLQISPDQDKSEIINNLLIERFIKEFYSFMNYKINYIDLLSDSTLNYEYLKYADEDSTKLLSLAHINSIYGDISFINTNEETYTKSIDKIYSNKSSITYINNSAMMDTTEIFFVCNTSFYTFMESFLYLPIGSILESTDIKIVYASDNYILPIEMAKYQTRISSILDKLGSERSTVYSRNSSNVDNKSGTIVNIDDYNLIPLNARIQYTFKFKLSEISDILITWENKINNEKIYGDNNNYISKEILKMISLMKSYAIAAYKTIIK